MWWWHCVSCWSMLCLCVTTNLLRWWLCSGVDVLMSWCCVDGDVLIWRCCYDSMFSCVMIMFWSLRCVVCCVLVVTWLLVCWQCFCYCSDLREKETLSNCSERRKKQILFTIDLSVGLRGAQFCSRKVACWRKIEHVFFLEGTSIISPNFLRPRNMILLCEDDPLPPQKKRWF
jgi:hypothetical protein